jgi:hypothetical protein
MMSVLLALGMVFCGALEAQDQKQDKSSKPMKAKEAKSAVRKAIRPTHREKLPQFTPERETASLSFVKEQHPQLIAVLERLKKINPEEYQWAIREIASDCDQLSNVKNRDANEYAVQLEAWRLRSKVGLAAADLNSKRTDEKEQKLKDLLRLQLLNQIKQQELERERIATRLAAMDKRLAELKQASEQTIDTRYQRLVKSKRPNRPGKEGVPTKDESQKSGEQKEQNQ